MHLTLNFIGEADLDRVVDALQAVRFPAFPLTLCGVGQFPSAGGDVTLWAGVKDPVKLRELHQAAGGALSLKGFPSESRPYNPHVTLARCKAGVSPEIVRDFLIRNAHFEGSPILVSEFRLYSSSPGAEGPVYRRERAFELPPG
jgi:2'-5' RNA ligase